MEWACPSCGQWNSVESLHCLVCGTPLSARYEATEDTDEPPWTTALLLSVILPGAGHIAAGRIGSGIARAVLFAVWLGGGVLLSGGGSRSAVLVAAPLYLGAGALWLGSLVDLSALRSGGRELIDGRVLLWLVVTVLALSALAVMAAFSSSAAGAPA